MPIIPELAISPAARRYPVTGILDHAMIQLPGGVFARHAYPMPLDQIWYKKDGTAPVSLTERVNGHGLSDMAGNVNSWVADVYEPTAYGALPQVDPVNLPRDESDPSRRSAHGGSWYDRGAGAVRVGGRGGYDPGGRCGRVGVRLGALSQPS